MLSGFVKAQDVAIPGIGNIDELTPAALAALPPRSREMVAAIYANAFHPVFLSMAGLIAIGLVAAISLKNTRLPTIRA